MEFANFAVALGLLATPAFAHHSFQAQYDDMQTTSVTGIVTKVQWQNPHVRVNVDVKGEQPGAGMVWELELDSPNMLLSQGWKLDSLKPGQQITAKGARARDGSNALRARSITLAAR